MRIEWIAAGDRSFASSRLRAHKIADELKKLGHEVSFAPLFRVEGDYAFGENSDVLVAQKTPMSDWLQARIGFARQDGTKIIYDVDDLQSNIPFDQVDIVTTDTNYKRDYWGKSNVRVIPDALDIDDHSPFKTKHHDHLEGVVWVGNSENLYHLTNVAEACLSLHIPLFIITSITSMKFRDEWALLSPDVKRNICTRQWNLDTVDQELVQHDLFVAPFTFRTGSWSDEWVLSKSCNRIAKAHALGLPVAATPIPSYLEFGLRYAATTVEEWIKVLQEADDREDRMASAEIGCREAQKYRAEVVAKQWVEVFGG